MNGKLSRRGSIVLTGAFSLSLFALCTSPAHADGDITKVNHIIIVMQENHSFDNYLGALPYAHNTPYHNANSLTGGPGCGVDDHTCVDGFTGCETDTHGNFTCQNSNSDESNTTVFAFHDPRYCTGPDLDHSWEGAHLEANFSHPGNALIDTRNDGFVLQNDKTEQIDKKGAKEPNPDALDDTLGFYTDADLPFYYALAQTFAIDDRYFCSVLGQTFPNRSYEVAGTSFGHLTTSEITPPVPKGYQPITGTIYQLLDANHIKWINYYSDTATSRIFVQPFTVGGPNRETYANFLTDAKNGKLPPVAFVDPSFHPDQTINGISKLETDEHPPNDIRAGEYYVSTLVQALRKSPNWKDSIMFITYDEHGGYYDHVTPPAAPQGVGNPLNPDGIDPANCEDLSSPPKSKLPGGGANCKVSVTDAQIVCPSFKQGKPYPASCPNFNQLGFRVPFIAVSPFSKPAYVSHTIGDHTSMLKFIEERFLPPGSHLTLRDQNAADLNDMFDFDNSPSLTATIPAAPLPTKTDPGCPFKSNSPVG